MASATIDAIIYAQSMRLNNNLCGRGFTMLSLLLVELNVSLG